MGRKQRPLLMGSNLKMFKTAEQTRAYLEALQNLTADIPRTEVQLFIIPSYIALPAALQQVDQNLIRIGAQNVFWEDAGAWTGEVSPVMLKDLGVTLVELGHSERREHFGETDLTVQRKVQAVLRNGMHALICVGETAQDKELGVGPERLREQVKIALHGVPEEALEHIWIAYSRCGPLGSGSSRNRALCQCDARGDPHSPHRALPEPRSRCTGSVRRKCQFGKRRVLDRAAGR